MAAAASAVIVPALAKGARSAAGTISEALTADLAVVRWSYQPRARRKVKPAPVDMELHVNPAAIGVAAVGIGLGLWLTQTRVGFESVSVGRWKWPSDSSWASPQLLTEAKGTAAQRLKPLAYQTEKPVLTDSNKLTWAILMAQWTVANTEQAIWVDQGTKTTARLKERQGFLGNGLGTIVGDVSIPLWAKMLGVGVFGPVTPILGGLFK